MIDILFRDILYILLVYIIGREVVDGNREFIWNLLEIFGGLLEYIFNKIDSDVLIDGKNYKNKKRNFMFCGYWRCIYVIGEGLIMIRFCFFFF